MTVVPDSGTGELIGLVSRLVIKIVEGHHSCDFNYTFTATPWRFTHDRICRRNTVGVSATIYFVSV